MSTNIHFIAHREVTWLRAWGITVLFNFLFKSTFKAEKGKI